MTHTCSERITRAHTLDDPFTHDLKHACWLITELFGPKQMLDIPRGAIPKLIVGLHNLRFVTLKSSGVLLPIALDSFSDFKTNYAASLTLLEQAVNQPRNQEHKEIIRARHKEAEQLFKRVCAMHKKITPAHIELQSHFHKLMGVSQFSTHAESELFDTLLTPVYELRDEYFDVPDAKIIRSYLKASELLMQDSRYKAHVRTAIDSNIFEQYIEHLDAHAVKLETLSLLS